MSIVLGSVLLSLAVAFLSQASSPNYRQLFFSLLPLAVLNVVSILFVFASKQKRHVWLVGVAAAVGFACLVEMALRVFLGLRLL
jgi:fatty acid desaturase